MRQYGNSIKEQRLAKGLSLLDVERATGISNGSLCRWENNQVIPGINFCEQLAQFYGITIDELVGLSDSPMPQKNTTLPAIPTNAISFVKEYEDIIPDKNFITMAKLYKKITPELRALTLGYIVGVLQNNGVNTKKILGY